ncbi:MAG: hypothetical protein WBW47_04680 [Thermoplasmata archaeon]
MSESSKLAAFLLALQTSPSAQNRFKEDPEGELKRFDLSTSTIKAINDGNAEALWLILTRVPGHVGVVISHVGVVTARERRGRRRKKKAT